MKCVMGVIACIVGLVGLIGLIVLKATSSSATYMDDSFRWGGRDRALKMIIVKMQKGIPIRLPVKH